MKTILIALSVILLTAYSDIKQYNDGHYTGVSRSIYTDEPYYGQTEIDIVNGKITRVEFIIRDSVKHENFDGNYEKYFAGIEEYIIQCRNDWKGVRSYPDSLLKYQDIDSLDAVSGATWSFNIFKASVNEALDSAFAEN
jgi:major membrane immunogen (membrane-anchored lipoprotein)